MNEPLRIAVCEDQIKDRELLLDYIKQFDFDTKCDTFSSAEAFFIKFKPGTYHLIYLDIFMTGMTGLEAAETIRKIDRHVMLVFTTSSRDYALEAQQYRSLLYIEKPVTRQMIHHTLMLTEALYTRLQHEILTIPGGNKKQMDIHYGDIRYIEVQNKRCLLYLASGTIVDTATTIGLSELEALLPQSQFCRTHRSFIVNFEYVDHPNQTDFVMKGGGIVYITQAEHDRIIDAYDEYLFTLAREEHAL